MRGVPVNLERRPMFMVPYWDAKIDSVIPFHGEMIQELDRQIDEELGEGRANPFTAHQTHSDPFDLPSRGWRELDTALRSALSTVAAQTFRRQKQGEFHLRRWAVRYGRLNEEEKSVLRRDGVHNHMPALLSSIYYLSVPPELPEAQAGTLFFSPLGGHLRFVAEQSTTIGGREGDLVIFPAQVDHSTMSIDWDAGEAPRVVIVSDLYYVSGFQQRSSDSRVVRSR